MANCVQPILIKAKIFLPCVRSEPVTVHRNTAVRGSPDGETFASVRGMSAWMGCPRTKFPRGSGSRVELLMHAFEPRVIDVRVDLGGLDIGVAEHLLHHPQIGSAGEQVGRKAVPQ